ncbi:MAG: hypothetical protein CV087_23865 [Candidatus Brocadia sp. WS118]|nr:MAG: hypothetical protein CV087_23865 [Candidatus Brocadia sp. WS118]
MTKEQELPWVIITSDESHGNADYLVEYAMVPIAKARELFLLKQNAEDWHSYYVGRISKLEQEIMKTKDLREENERMARLLDSVGIDARSYKCKVVEDDSKLLGENQRLREALAVYADKDNWLRCEWEYTYQRYSYYYEFKEKDKPWEPARKALGDEFFKGEK